MPQNAEGIRIEPPPSLPTLRFAIPVIAATAAPPEEPPGVRVTSHGLRVSPLSGLSHRPFQPCSGVVVLPSSTAPASRRRATTGESSVAGASDVVSDPLRVGHPVTSDRSLIDAGTPSSGPSAVPLRHRASLARACSSARSSSTRTNAPSSPSSARIRSSAPTAASTGESVPAAYAAARVSTSSIGLLGRAPGGSGVPGTIMAPTSGLRGGRGGSARLTRESARQATDG